MANTNVRTKYKTKHRQEILNYVQDQKGNHFTVSDICSALASRGTPIGTTTVYRQLERLSKEGVVVRYTSLPGEPACFAYIGDFLDENVNGADRTTGVFPYINANGAYSAVDSGSAIDTDAGNSSDIDSLIGMNIRADAPDSDTPRNCASACYHFRCETCGRLLHISCDELKRFSMHISLEHEFDLDFTRTVFVGKCKNCRGEKNNGTINLQRPDSGL